MLFFIACPRRHGARIGFALTLLSFLLHFRINIAGSTDGALLANPEAVTQNPFQDLSGTALQQFGF